MVLFLVTFHENCMNIVSPGPEMMAMVVAPGDSLWKDILPGWAEKDGAFI